MPAVWLPHAPTATRSAGRLPRADGGGARFRRGDVPAPGARSVRLAARGPARAVEAARRGRPGRRLDAAPAAPSFNPGVPARAELLSRARPILPRRAFISPGGAAMPPEADAPGRMWEQYRDYLRLLARL